MTLQEAIRNRHSVRAYEDKPIEQDKRAELDAFVEECNRESGLDIKVVYDDPEGFDSRLAVCLVSHRSYTVSAPNTKTQS